MSDATPETPTACANCGYSIENHSPGSDNCPDIHSTIPQWAETKFHAIRAETPTAITDCHGTVFFGPKAETPTAGQDGDIRNSPRSWQDDFAHENGNYLNECRTCAQRFLGHKRRIQCRQCANREARKPIALHIVNLLPCPFCGDGDVEMAESATPKIGGGNKAAVFCNSCFCEGPPCENEAVAREAWNSRSLAAQLAQAQQNLDSARDVIEESNLESDRLRQQLAQAQGEASALRANLAHADDKIQELQ